MNGYMVKFVLCTRNHKVYDSYRRKVKGTSVNSARQVNAHFVVLYLLVYHLCVLAYFTDSVRSLRYLQHR